MPQRTQHRVVDQKEQVERHQPSRGDRFPEAFRRGPRHQSVHCQFAPQQQRSPGWRQRAQPQDQVGEVVAEVAELQSGTVALARRKVTAPLPEKMAEGVGRRHADPALRLQAHGDALPGKGPHALQKEVVVAAQRGPDIAEAPHRRERRPRVAPVAPVGDHRRAAPDAGARHAPAQQLLEYQKPFPDRPGRGELHQAHHSGDVRFEVAVHRSDVFRCGTDIGIQKKKPVETGRGNGAVEGVLFGGDALRGVFDFQDAESG